MEIRKVKISTIKPNPSNPRVIRDDKFHKLVNSIREFPEMLNIRPIVINSEKIILGGNMRLKACLEAGLKMVPVIDAGSLTPAQQQEFMIKDNVGFGEWDFEDLANNYDTQQLTDWGLDVINPADYSDPEQDQDGSPGNGMKRNHFSFSTCYDTMTSSKIKYFALFRNNDMDLEDLKKSPINVEPFVFPVFSYLKKNNITKLILAPAGQRAETNGFHFVTELIERVRELIDIETFSPFTNIKNKIKLTGQFDQNATIFDDIVTRGTTIKKMNELTGISSNLILITNH